MPEILDRLSPRHIVDEKVRYRHYDVEKDIRTLKVLD